MKEFYQEKLSGNKDQSVIRFGTVADVTPQIESENKIRKSEEKFRGLINSMTDGIVISGSDGKIEIVNKELERMTGYNRNDLIGKPIEILIPARFSEHKVHRNKYGENPYVRNMNTSNNLFVLRRDGSEFSADISLSPLKIGDEMTVTATIRDVSARKKTEKILQQYKHIVNRVPEHLSFLDTDYKFLAVNKAFLDAYSLSEDEIIGYTPEKLYGKEIYQQQKNKYYSKCLAGETINVKLWRRLAKYDGERFLDLCYTPYK